MIYEKIEFNLETVHSTGQNCKFYRSIFGFCEVIFQLITDVERFYVMGIYIPPNDSSGVDDLWATWNSCPVDCIPIILGNLNINFEHPRDYREEAIADLINEINLVNASWKFALQRCWMQGATKRWTWLQMRMGRWHQSQPD